MKTSLSLGLLVAMCSPTWLGAQFPPGGHQLDRENAAVKYLRADASLRQSYVLAPDAAAKLLQAGGVTLGGGGRKLGGAGVGGLVGVPHRACPKRCESGLG